jgi:hypothetical protein
MTAELKAQLPIKPPQPQHQTMQSPTNIAA